MSHTEYLQAQVLTASPHRLHLLVVDGAIRHALRAEEALSSGDFETAHAALNKSRDFVAELLAGLDGSQAPDLIARLKSLFLFVHRRLVEADRLRNPALVRDALEFLEQHRTTWVEVGRLQRPRVSAEVAEGSRSWTT